MPEPVSALSGVSADAGYVKVTEIGPQGMITLRCDPLAPFVRRAVSKIGGAVPLPLTIGHKEDVSVAWMARDELLILCPYGDAAAKVAALDASLEGAHALAANVSDARAMFRLEGDQVREVVAKLAPVDLDPASFQVGMFRRTRLAQSAAAFYLRDETTCEIVCFRSVAQYVFDLLAKSAAPGGDVNFFKL